VFGAPPNCGVGNPPGGETDDHDAATAVQCAQGNVEGIAWLTRDTLVAVSDRRKSDQPDRCGEKDQSIHVFRLPAP
jgi:hypothetical protein